ncbi:hypothetical protein DNU06_11615 [Putridiphycobacter roseus]|uniref:HEAT repeat domain-containing protein n=1 Tax=Putridiphycobacter roseus TaxID=2219161 RepID=A0A2W1MZR0_9FLAO|nr:HEAT repeat domain-containing protein [Putridiphycobacter roseus]PZE16894.1 hypothetical protein DNU06_11615 [Putridiphycobacter roseus]
MSTTKKPNKKVSELLGKLNDSEPKEVIKAIEALKLHGNEMIIEPLVKLHVSTSNNAIKSEIETLLNTIKSTKVPPYVIACLQNKEYQSAHQILLSSIWNSNLDYTPYLEDIVNTAIAGDLMEAMECITIFENLEAELDEEKIMPPLIALNKYLNEPGLETTAKHDLLKEVALFLNHVNQTL